MGTKNTQKGKKPPTTEIAFDRGVGVSTSQRAMSRKVRAMREMMLIPSTRVRRWTRVFGRRGGGEIGAGALVSVKNILS